MSDVKAVKEALRADEEFGGQVSQEHYESLRNAARRWAEGLDYEAARLHGRDKALELVPFWTQEIADIPWDSIIDAAVDAAIGEIDETPHRKLDPAWDGSQPYGGV